MQGFEKVVDIPHEVTEIAVSRHVEQAFAKRHWATMVLILRCSVNRVLKEHPSGDELCEVNLDVLPVDRRMAFQMRTLVKCFIDLMRADKECDAIRELYGLIDTEKVLAKDFRQELTELQSIIYPWQATYLKELEQRRNKFVNDVGSFHKSLTLFPSGCELMDQCEKARLAMMEDISCEDELKKLTTPAPVTFASDIALDTVLLPDDTAWKRLFL